MDRLTWYDNDGGIWCRRGYEVALARLASYEATGLTPEEIECISKCANEDKAITKCPECLDARLRELAEADKNERVVVLPCKVGDTVYQLRKKTHARGMGISPRIVSSACVWADGSYQAI